MKITYNMKEKHTTDGSTEITIKLRADKPPMVTVRGPNDREEAMVMPVVTLFMNALAFAGRMEDDYQAALKIYRAKVKAAQDAEDAKAKLESPLTGSGPSVPPPADEPSGEPK